MIYDVRLKMRCDYISNYGDLTWGILFLHKATGEIMIKMLKTYGGMVESIGNSQETRNYHWRMLEHIYIYINT